MWGAALRPGREKFSLHSRHVCDVPEGDAVGHIGPIGRIGRGGLRPVYGFAGRPAGAFLFSVFCSLFSGARQRPLPYASSRKCLALARRE